MIEIKEYAETIRTMIQHQESRMADGVKSALTLQGLLFASIGLSFGKIVVLPVILSAVGLVTTLALIAEYERANSAISKLIKDWATVSDEYVGPPVTAIDPSQISKFLFITPMNWFKGALMFAWGGLFGISLTPFFA